MDHRLAASNFTESVSTLITRRSFVRCAGVFLAASMHGAAWGSALLVDARFPGGNILVDKIEGDAVFLHPDLRGTSTDWFYWYFRVREAGGRTLTFRFPRDVIGVRGPGLSLDGGKTWQWLGAQSVVENSFSYYFPIGSPEVRFSVGMPYVEENLREFLARNAGNPYLRPDVLCKSEQGRSVELLHAGRSDGKPTYRILLTGRHHACEMMASYAIEGLIEGITASDGTGAWFQKYAEVLVIPFMDKDGVEAGDQGKNRAPHDHNRDYKDPSIYASVRALREYVPRWAQPGLDFALDIHDPVLRTGSNEQLAFIGSPFPENWARVEEFCAVLESIQQGPLPYSVKNNMPYGQLWNVDYPYTDFDSWAVKLPGEPVTTTLELPYSNVAGQPVTAESARALGRSLAVALSLYLQKDRPRTANTP